MTLLVLNKTDELYHLIPDGVDLIDIKTNSASKSWLPLVQCIRELSPDIVYSTHSRIATLLMLVKPFVNRFYHIARMQGTPSLDIKHKQYGKVSRWLFSQGFKSADVVIAQTEEMKADAVACFSVAEAKIKVLNNPIDKSFIDSQIEGSPFKHGEVNAVASGRLTPAKGFDILIMALPEVIKTCPNFKMYILGGDQGESERLTNVITELGLSDFVHFEGFVDNPYRYYAHCDLFILSSRREGFPNVLLENYCLNTPIVATRCVPIVEQLVIDGENGYTCSVDDEIELSNAIIRCLELKRDKINNNFYQGSSLEELF